MPVCDKNRGVPGILSVCVCVCVCVGGGRGWICRKLSSLPKKNTNRFINVRPSSRDMSYIIHCFYSFLITLLASRRHPSFDTPVSSGLVNSWDTKSTGSAFTEGAEKTEAEIGDPWIIDKEPLRHRALPSSETNWDIKPWKLLRLQVLRALETSSLGNSSLRLPACEILRFWASLAPEKPFESLQNAEPIGCSYLPSHWLFTEHRGPLRRRVLVTTETQNLGGSLEFKHSQPLRFWTWWTPEKPA